jgi:hypothetical protein
LNKKSICKKIQQALFTEQRCKCYREKPVEEVAGKSKASKKEKAHSSTKDLLAPRRMKARHLYASMTPDQRQVYTSKCQERYHRLSEISQAKRCERQRTRYHSNCFGDDDHNHNDSVSIDSQDGDEDDDNTNDADNNNNTNNTADNENDIGDYQTRGP